MFVYSLALAFAAHLETEIRLKRTAGAGVAGFVHGFRTAALPEFNATRERQADINRRGQRATSPTGRRMNRAGGGLTGSLPG